MGDLIAKEFQDALGALRIQFVQFAVSFDRELNFPCHDAS